MPMYNLTECSNAYSKTSGSLWEYYTDTALENNDNIIDFPVDYIPSNLLKFKQQVTGQTGSDDT